MIAVQKSAFTGLMPKKSVAIPRRVERSARYETRARQLRFVGCDLLHLSRGDKYPFKAVPR